MIELNHTFGRVSDSPYNASPLCRECHSHVGHSKEEHGRLFGKTCFYLKLQGHNPSKEDLEFIDYASKATK
jgi:hypothetical protein